MQCKYGSAQVVPEVCTSAITQAGSFTHSSKESYFEDLLVFLADRTEPVLSCPGGVLAAGLAHPHLAPPAQYTAL
jgi:hypothetical protein